MAHPDHPVTAISAWAGSTNLGDELVLAALVAKLRLRGVEPHVLSVDPAATTTTHGVVASGLFPLVGGVARPSTVLFGGGGLLQDETSPFNLPFHLARTGLVRRGRPLAGIGLGAGPLRGALGRGLVRAVLRRSVATSVRDAGSQALLRSMGVPSLLAADLALSLPNPRVEVEGRLGVCLRPWTAERHLVPVGRRRAPLGGTPPWFFAEAAAALDAVAGRTGLAVHFVALQADRDHGVHQRVAGLMIAPSTFAVPGVGDVVAEVAACEAVVAMRYHAGVAAVLGGRPAVLIGYSTKVPALAAEVPAGVEGLTWAERSLDGLPAAVERVLGRGDAVVEGREALRAREQVNDDVLDRLLDGPTGGAA